ncbi:MAG: hypothetical protein IPK16_22900 [Anaerolineales bacterium]|nr:hypothetical protein [Anaerolineales bacterium]
MANNTARQGAQKITITLPRDVLARLNALVPPRQRSHFISEVLEARLALAEQLLALEDSAGSWQDESHPEMQDEDAIDAWLSVLRQSWSNQADGRRGELPA